jgi:ATP-dependent Clp protease ATP-binding subunit ClpC
MVNKFDKFSESARKVLTCAQEEAQRANNNRMDTDFLLLGLLRQEDTAAAKALFKLGLDIHTARQLVEKDVVTPGFIGVTPAVSKVINQATIDADKVIEPEDLLLALAQVNEGRSADILKLVEITPDQIITQVKQTFN